MKDIKELDKQYVMNTYNRFDLEIVEGIGVNCYDENGKEYLDFGAGIGVNCLGYCDIGWVSEVAKQACKLSHTSNLYYNEPCALLAEKLCKKTGYSSVFFGNSGAEANEGAIKLARKYSFDKYGHGRNKIITLVNSFHGRTLATLSATGQDVFHNYFYPFVEGFDYAIAGDFDDVQQKADENVCAIMLEFVQGEGGVVALEREFVTKVAALCKDKDILFIADEVKTGIGRTGKLFASENYVIKPNITNLAKG
ncbi:MAG: aminotransferase class III-fold pyridoxal phosphate-dependent enzyme, partial [Clostridia bacterium]